MESVVLGRLKQLKPVFQLHKVEKVYLFGSGVSSNFTNESDIDLLVSFQENLDPLEKGELWWSLYDYLKAHFNREIDLVTESSLKNPYFIEEVNNTKQLIYG